MRISDWSSDVCSSDLRTIKAVADRSHRFVARRRAVPGPVTGGAAAAKFSARPKRSRPSFVLCLFKIIRKECLMNKFLQSLAVVAILGGSVAACSSTPKNESTGEYIDSATLTTKEIGRASCRERVCQNV